MYATCKIFRVFFNYLNIIRVCNINYDYSVFSIRCTFSTNNTNFSVWRNFNIIYGSSIYLYTVNFFNVGWIGYIPKICCSISTPSPCNSIISFINPFKNPKVRCMFVIYQACTNIFNFSFNISFKNIYNLRF